MNPLTLNLSRIGYADHGERESVNALLRACDLPPITNEERPQILVFRQDNSILGCAGWEQYGSLALLRSVAVSPNSRKQNIGDILCRVVLERLDAVGVTDAYLLTTSARDFFLRFGFEEVSRCSLPDALKQSNQVESGCCASAVAMRRPRNSDQLIRYVILLTQVAGFETTFELIGQHVEYLRTLDRQGKLVSCGPFASFAGGMLVVRAKTCEEASNIASNDPFVKAGSRTFEVREWKLSCEENNHLGAG